MKSILVKNKGSIACYSSGYKSRYDNENKKWETIEETDEEMEQSCYQSLISDIQRKEFEKTIKAILLGYLEWEQKDVQNIQIIIKGNNGRNCEMNIHVTDVWEKLEIELPKE